MLLWSTIKCFYKSNSKIPKENLVLGNFYRHLLTHNKFNPEVKKKSQK